jgi:2-C-methyl-D-erythritol 4-phosphate cytidylyltransferase
VKHKDENFTDDASILEEEGMKVKVIEGEKTNIKITTQEDLK